MGEIGVGMRADILLHRLPVTGVRANAFAPGTNRDEARKGFHVREGFLEFRNQLFTLHHGFLLLADIAEKTNVTHRIASFICQRSYYQQSGKTAAIFAYE